MKRITEQQYQICKEHGLLYDGKNVYKGLDKRVERSAYFGRTWIRTKNAIYVTEGQDGIYDAVLNLEKNGVSKNGGRK